MNPTQLRKLGVPDEVVPVAIRCLQQMKAVTGAHHHDVKARLAAVVAAPTEHLDDAVFGPFAEALVQSPAEVEPDRDPVSYQTWGTDIDPAAHHQMQQACTLPAARGAALMPDAHVGYGLPIGGVLAMENAVVPYAVGVDIACRMKLSVLDLPVTSLTDNFHRFEQSLERGTRFGIGAEHERPQDHAVLDQDWSVTAVTRDLRDKARRQLGTSGSGNHFVEFGVLTLGRREEDLGLDAGVYVALLSHSGSRGSGAAVCEHYSRLAQRKLPQRYAHLGRLGWLELTSQEGQEYWEAMNLMGDYAAANHEIIHRLVAKSLGAHVLAGVENHHNFAWKETHGDRELIVHRKGATPAGPGVLGVIPGSMADPGFVVRGKGGTGSFDSASHGAGRRMSRTQAKQQFNLRLIRKDLELRGIRLISAGADEVPQAYKDIQAVMEAQEDLVELVARFDPKIVKMAPGGRAED